MVMNKKNYNYAGETCLILSGLPYFHILDGLPKSLFTASDTIYFFFTPFRTADKHL